MTLPNQPASPVDVIGNEEFFRIRQPVQSPGAVFEIDSSTHAIYLGPDSDISEVRLLYYDSQAARNMNLADISAGGPFVNRVDSLLATQYPGIGQAGRILAYPLDVVDPSYRRTAPSAPETPARFYNLIPYIDLICALKPMASIPQERPDRTYRLKVPVQNVAIDPLTDDGSTDVAIPIYGRRLVSIDFTLPVMVPITASLFLVSLPPNASTSVAIPLNVLGPVADTFGPSSWAMIYRASNETTRTSLASVSSDPTFPDYATTGSSGGPTSGMGDLLIVNFKPTLGGPGYSMLDVNIRVSDHTE